MAVARAYGVPRSMVLGEGLQSVTTYEYDDATGRLVRSVTVHESPWTAENFGFAVAHEEEIADQCPRCTQPLSETTAMKDGEPVHVYTADDPARCYSCDARIKKEEAHGKSGQVLRPEALIWTTRRDS